MEVVNRDRLGQIVILNGVPRSGKSSIARAIQETFGEPWMSLGVDIYARHITPERYRPSIGLRPGGERPDLEPLIPVFYAALYESVGAHSRLGLNVVVDVGHHDCYRTVHGIQADCARRLIGLPVLLVGVRCPVETIMQRRRESQARHEGEYLAGSPNEPVPAPVLAWQREVHRLGLYDLEVDTSVLTPSECAAVIRERLDRRLEYPSASRQVAGLTD
jgi:chloramphenicol 3-O phosphotransferase